ncbi:MAG: stress-induced protein [Mycobacteriaceae bacterium]|nr:stress-induced protein [Mycobacteriaceae bacterium]
MAQSRRGFAAMDEEKQRRIASKGGKASSGSFDNDPKRAAEAGRKGAAAQPTEAKQRGGQNSHANR